MRSVSKYSWLGSHTPGRFGAPKASLEAKMDKNCVLLRVQETRMAHGDRRGEQVCYLYVEKWS